MRRGWFNESYRHYLAGKGISTNRFLAIKRTRLSDKEFRELLEKETQQGAFSRAEITPEKAPRGKKAKLLQERDWRRDALTALGHDPDLNIDEVKKEEVPDFVYTHYQVLDDVENQIKRIQSNPAYKTTQASSPEAIRRDLYDIHAGTSQKKSEKLKTLVGYDLDKRVENPLESKAREVRVAKKNLETANIKRVTPILIEQAETAAFEGKRTPQVRLKDVAKQTKRGRPRKYLAKITKQSHDWVAVDGKYEIALTSDSKIDKKDYANEIKSIKSKPVASLKKKYGERMIPVNSDKKVKKKALKSRFKVRTKAAFWQQFKPKELILPTKTQEKLNTGAIYSGLEVTGLDKRIRKRVQRRKEYERLMKK